MVPPSTMDLARRAEIVVRTKWRFADAFLGTDEEPEAWLEALLHEASHALQVGLGKHGLADNLPMLVSTSISDDASVECEAKALATEWFAWRMLGLPYEWADLEDLASIQGVSEEALFEAVLDPTNRARAPALLDLVRRGLSGERGSNQRGAS